MMFLMKYFEALLCFSFKAINLKQCEVRNEQKSKQYSDLSTKLDQAALAIKHAIVYKGDSRKRSFYD